jgi:hypothetical protein
MIRVAALALSAVIAFSSVIARADSFPFAAGSAQDEAAIRAIVADAGAGRPNPHIAANLDWENAFGIRYADLAKRDAFYHAVVSPLQKDDTDTTLEVKVRFLDAGTAVADEYWHIAGQLDVATHKPGPDRWGRTTYIFSKRSGSWTEMLERVADLRLAYYHHYDVLPQAAPVPAAALASYAGNYEFADDHGRRTISVAGDHLVFASAAKTRVAIPTSAADFLLFDPNDLAEYAKLHFAPAGGGMTATLSDETGETLGTLKKVE